MVFSASFIFAQERAGDGLAFVKKQLLFAFVGGGAMVVASRIHYRHWLAWAYPSLGVATLLLALVLVPGLGAKAGGATRWLAIGPIHFQPGELAKFAIVLFVARQLVVKQDRLDRWSAGVLGQFLAPLPALLLLLAQPDFGTVVMVVGIVFALMFVAGVPKRLLATTVGVAVVAGSLLAVSSPYRRARIASFLDPWSDPGGRGFQALQSFLGFHNGSVWGVGLGDGKEKLFYLPEAHNDFIFAVIGEELGFIGVAAVVLAYLFFIHRGIQIGWRCQRMFQDRFGLYLATGITLALGAQAFVNMAVVLGLLPTKGLTLPFVSYGGSALLTDLFCCGILLSIARGSAARQ